MGANKINILSYLKINEYFSEILMNEYKSLFDFYLENKNFCNHGDTEKWRNILNSLPGISTNYFNIQNNKIIFGRSSEINTNQKKILEKSLLNLSPWRKGPFSLFGIDIDSEWRSDIKWNRLKNFFPKLKGMRIGDLGCSNGYYSYKLLNLEPDLIVGLDRTPLYIYQFLSTKFYAKNLNNIIILPCTAEDFLIKSFDFDLLLSMGILYHTKDPVTHFQTINKLLKKNGHLILESIISTKKEDIVIEKNQTYAGMRNIKIILRKNNIINLLKKNGFKNIECINESFTDKNEQRSTKWMTGKSLSDFLLPNGKTIEGFPPISRAIFIAQKI